MNRSDVLSVITGLLVAGCVIYVGILSYKGHVHHEANYALPQEPAPSRKTTLRIGTWRENKIAAENQGNLLVEDYVISQRIEGSVWEDKDGTFTTFCRGHFNGDWVDRAAAEQSVQQCPNVREDGQ